MHAVVPMPAVASDGRPHNAIAGIRGIRRRLLTQRTVFMSKSAAVIWLGARHIADAIAHIGWIGLAYVVAWQLAVYVGLGLAWAIVCPGVSAWKLIWARLVREGGQTCLPFSEIGGLIFGSRALMLCGVDLALAASSSIVDVATEGISLAPFMLFGLLTMLLARPHAALILPASAGLGLLLLGGVSAYLLRRRLSDLLRIGTEWLLKKWVQDAPQKSEDMERLLRVLFGRHGRIVGASMLHLLCWAGGGVNIWIVYHLLGAKPSLADALAIESILSAVLGVGFLVPAGVGVQELGYVGIGQLFGIPPYLSLALSLIRRARDILIGAPALLVWQGLEAREVHATRR